MLIARLNGNSCVDLFWYTAAHCATFAAEMSPTVRRSAGYRFFFFSREESRPHVHVQHATGEAKFWLYPEIELAQNWGLADRRLTVAPRLAREYADEIREAWEAHFGG